MSDEPSQAWDLTPVIDLIHSVPYSGELPPLDPSACDRSGTLNDFHQDAIQTSALGDFTKLWQALGRSDVSPPQIKPSIKDAHRNQERLSSTFRERAALKAVRWRDDDGITDLEDGREGGASVSLSGRGQYQRDQKLAKKERRAAGKRVQELGNDPNLSASATSDFESETELSILRTSPRSKPITIPGSRRLQDDATTVGYSSSPLTSTSPPKRLIHRPTPLAAIRPASIRPTSNKIEPLRKQTPPDRKVTLMKKLIRDFPAERGSLLRHPTPLSAITTTSSQSNAIHVFIDSSNIMIGFFDTLKRARGISYSLRTRRVPLSFHSLALILERGRPVSKRVLAGSQPLVPSETEAEHLGYETNILDRVLKARERNNAHRPQRFANGNTMSGPSSGSDTSVAQRMVEQGVDEILHLKILESIIDARRPSTIVLATGDAAEAEYSQGFMRMVERALERGWVVELVSFTLNMSSAYRKPAFLHKWGQKFKIVELDAYCEELLDM
ncbi:MAG: hypothetical protein M1833_005048 [Piccolia ochrophora]|nr:MAG: hypothetical protein M1833_005048 [Piccolia ochrophora]